MKAIRFHQFGGPEVEPVCERESASADGSSQAKS
jgi:hypothetical protein